MEVTVSGCDYIMYRTVGDARFSEKIMEMDRFGISDQRSANANGHLASQ